MTRTISSALLYFDRTGWYWSDEVLPMARGRIGAALHAQYRTGRMYDHLFVNVVWHIEEDTFGGEA